MTGFVYAIEGAENRIKIGWSAGPMRRLSKLRSDCSAEVVLLGLVEATREQEGELHRLLEPWRLHGEWFAHEGAVCQFIELLPTPAIRAVNQQMIPAPASGCAATGWRAATSRPDAQCAPSSAKSLAAWIDNSWRGNLGRAARGSAFRKIACASPSVGESHRHSRVQGDQRAHLSLQETP